MKFKILAALASLYLSSAEQAGCTLPPDTSKQLIDPDAVPLPAYQKGREPNKFQTRYQNVLKKYDIKGYDTSFYRNPLFPQIQTILVAGGSRDKAALATKFDLSRQSTKQTIVDDGLDRQIPVIDKQIPNRQDQKVVRYQEKVQPTKPAIQIKQVQQTQSPQQKPIVQVVRLPLQDQETPQPIPDVEPVPEEVPPQIPAQLPKKPIVPQQTKKVINIIKKEPTLNPLDAIARSPDVNVTTTANGAVMIGRSGTAQGGTMVSKPGGRAVGTGGVVIASNGRSTSNKSFSTTGGGFSASDNAFIASIQPPQPELVLQGLRRIS